MNFIKKIYSVDPRKNKKIKCGVVVEGKFYRHVDSKKHFMRVTKGYGIQEDGFEKIVKMGVKKIIIKEDDTGKNFIADLEMWKTRGVVKNYGSGKQRFLAKYLMEPYEVPEVEVR